MNTVYKFSSDKNIKDWHIVDDVVMGGRSHGSFFLNADGNGVFAGEVSLKNKGGFSSVRYPIGALNLQGATKIVLRIHGDGKDYQFRVKEKSSDSHSYTATFNTSGHWEEITILLNALTPTYRGKSLDKPNFSAQTLEEIVFLIANKKAETFALIIDSIKLE